MPEPSEFLRASEALQGTRIGLVSSRPDIRWERDGPALPRSLVALEDRIYVASSGSPYLRAFFRSGEAWDDVRALEPESFVPVRYDQFQPVGLAVSPGEDGLAIAHGGRPVVSLRELDGTPRRAFDFAVMGILDITEDPATGGFAFTPMNTDYASEVSLPSSSELFRVDASGRVVQRIPLDVPGAVATGPLGELYVCEISSETLATIEPDGTVARRIRLAGASAAVRLAFSEHGALWVLDGAAATLSAFDPDGTLLAPPVDLLELFGATGTDSYKFCDIAAAPGGELLILYVNFHAGVRRFEAAMPGYTTDPEAENP